MGLSEKRSGKATALRLPGNIDVEGSTGVTRGVDRRTKMHLE